MTMNPNITIHDAITGETTTREMTDDEYAELLDSGWEPGPENDNP